jgi:hypothetical protein
LPKAKTVAVLIRSLLGKLDCNGIVVKSPITDSMQTAPDLS